MLRITNWMLDALLLLLIIVVLTAPLVAPGVSDAGQEYSQRSTFR